MLKLLALSFTTVQATEHLKQSDLASDPVFIRFDEVLKGFGIQGGSDDDTLEDFQKAYDQGKLANSTLSFSARVTLRNIAGFVKDELHRGGITGSATADTITGPDGRSLEEGATISIFPRGVTPTNTTHELGMKYTLPFQDEQGKNYTMVGVKHIPGNDCLRLLQHITTLYVHVRDMDTPAPHKIVRKGIVHIDLLGALSLIASLRIGGGTTKLQEVDGLVLFAAFLGKDVVQDCLTKGVNLLEFEGTSLSTASPHKEQKALKQRSSGNPWACAAAHDNCMRGLQRITTGRCYYLWKQCDGFAHIPDEKKDIIV